MGAPKLKWSPEEEQALRNGVAKFGNGKWRAIQKDPELGRFLANRSNVDLKDKWRNLTAAANEGRTTLPDLPENPAPVPKSPRGKGREPAGQSALGAPKPKKVRYEDMVVQAVTELAQGADGVSAQGVAKWIEEYHEVPNNFRKTLNTHLAALVQNGKLVKVGANAGNYRLGDGTAPQPGPPVPAKTTTNAGASASAGAGASAGNGGGGSAAAGAAGAAEAKAEALDAAAPLDAPPPPAASAVPPPPPAKDGAGGGGIPPAPPQSSSAFTRVPTLPPKKKAKLAAAQSSGRAAKSKPPLPLGVDAAGAALELAEKELAANQAAAQAAANQAAEAEALAEATAKEAEAAERERQLRFASRPPKKRAG